MKARSETIRSTYPALATDLYQLTMSYGYWKTHSDAKEAVFNLFFRKNPFKGGFSIACGLTDAIGYLQSLEFSDDDLTYLAGLTGNDGKPLFEPAFIEHLRAFEFTCDVDAIPEGTVVFPHEPLLRVQGPIGECQLVETALLNILNFQTLIATKSARVCLAAQGESVLEFGLRRAQGADGALTASRAAYIGGCDATSNVLAGKLFGIPVRGTHAHSWVTSFDNELEAFEAYAEAMPNNCVFLVDTYNTIEGIRRAIETGHRLRKEHGQEMLGVRLDSGDLAYLSIEARRMLDEAGFQNAQILATNDLDEHIIVSLKDQGATITTWGVGTKLVTAYDQPALGGVYKLTAVRYPGEPWSYKIKLSEQTAKISSPGIQQVRRFRDAGEFIGDMIYDIHQPVEHAIIDPLDLTRRKQFPSDAEHSDLLVPVFRGGKLVYDQPSIHEIRTHAQQQLAGFHSGIKRFLNPHTYPVGLAPTLHELRTELILAARGQH